jgi:hypothetical protein
MGLRADLDIKKKEKSLPLAWNQISTKIHIPLNHIKYELTTHTQRHNLPTKASLCWATQENSLTALSTLQSEALGSIARMSDLLG